VFDHLALLAIAEARDDCAARLVGYADAGYARLNKGKRVQNEARARPGCGTPRDTPPAGRTRDLDARRRERLGRRDDRERAAIADDDARPPPACARAALAPAARDHTTVCASSPCA